MKKIAIILALVAMTASLAGCTDEKDEGTTTSTNSSAVVSEDKSETEDTSAGSADKTEGSDDTSKGESVGSDSAMTSASAVSNNSEGTVDTPKKKPIEDADDIDPLSDDINHHEYVESSVRDNDEIEGN